MAKAQARPAQRRARVAAPGTASERMQWAPARHAAAAQDVGVREWGQLLVERGQQLLSRGEREAEAAALTPTRSDGTARPAGAPDRRRRTG
jgi:hypothetical protein